MDCEHHDLLEEVLKLIWIRMLLFLWSLRPWHVLERYLRHLRRLVFELCKVFLSLLHVDFQVTVVLWIDSLARYIVFVEVERSKEPIMVASLRLLSVDA